MTVRLASSTDRHLNPELPNEIWSDRLFMMRYHKITERVLRVAGDRTAGAGLRAEFAVLSNEYQGALDPELWS